jgi:hypothetical protein
MGTNQPDQEAAENRMHADDAREPRRKQRQKQNQRDHPLCRPVLDAPRPPQQKDKTRPDGIKEE